MIAFEAAARLGSLSKAAAELGTSQPVISRHIAKIEGQFSARLFHRTGTGVRPTDAGSHYQRAVARSLDILQVAGAEIADWSLGEQVVIAGTNETSYMFLMPHFGALREALGEQVGIRILNDFGLNIPSPPYNPMADVVLTWTTSSATWTTGCWWSWPTDTSKPTILTAASSPRKGKGTPSHASVWSSSNSRHELARAGPGYPLCDDLVAAEGCTMPDGGDACLRGCVWSACGGDATITSGSSVGAKAN